jgi:HAD superfamily hydrolase (TIGR01509 family)
MKPHFTAPEAVLLDFNGVLVDDERGHWRALRDVLAPLGVALPRARYEKRYLAFDDEEAVEAVLRDAGWPRGLRSAAFVATLVRRKRRGFRLWCARERLGVAPGACRTVRALAAGRPIAVVSCASRSEVTVPLRRAGLLSCFESIVTCEDVRRCKPHPEGYETALRRLGMRTGRTAVALEDSPGGIRAARAAGIPVLGVATSFEPAVLRRAGAYGVVRSLQRPAAVLASLRIEG